MSRAGEGAAYWKRDSGSQEPPILGESMRLLVTDVTEMHGGNYCVAGWDLQIQRMVRPLPNGANWTAGLLQQHSIVPGASIDVISTGQQHQSQFPHRTEDTPININSIQRVDAGPVNWFAGAPPVHGTVSAAFAGHVSHNSVWQNVRQGAFVTLGTQVGSLGAISLPRNAVQFVEEFDKLKIILDDGSARYKLAVSSFALKTAWRQGGLGAAEQALPATRQLHIRLGLARAFDNPPEKCYLMMNGIHG